MTSWSEFARGLDLVLRWFTLGDKLVIGDPTQWRHFVQFLGGFDSYVMASLGPEAMTGHDRPAVADRFVWDEGMEAPIWELEPSDPASADDAARRREVVDACVELLMAMGIQSPGQLEYNAFNDGYSYQHPDGHLVRSQARTEWNLTPLLGIPRGLTQPAGTVEQPSAAGAVTSQGRGAVPPSAPPA